MSVSEQFNYSRLDLARRRRGKTKNRLATEAELSVGILSKYERGTHLPKPETVSRFSSILQFPEKFFFGDDIDEPTKDGTSFRALSRLTAKQRDSALAAGAIAGMFSDWVSNRFSRLPEPQIPRWESIDPLAAAESLRDQWGLGSRPITNMIHLLESKGVKVFSLVEENREIDAFSLWRNESIPFVYLNTQKSPERSRMDAAHELGHLILHSRGISHGRDLETEANYFASAFLMPRESLSSRLPIVQSLEQLIMAKKYWKVSLASLVYRLHKVGILSEWQYRTFFKRLSQKGFRTEEPNQIPQETSKLLEKVLDSLSRKNIGMRHVATELNLYPQEIYRHLFGLTLLSPVESN